MGSDSTPKIQRVHASRSHSQSSTASLKDATQAQQPKRRKKKQDSEDITGRKPPKGMAVAQARKIMARKDLWGYRMLRKGFDPKVTAEAPPTASVLSFGGVGESTSYPISIGHALSDKLLGLEDLVEHPNSKYISQAGMSSTHMSRSEVPIAHKPNPSSNFHIFPDLPFPSGPPPSPLNLGGQMLYYGAPFPSTSRSPQPSETSEVGSESISSGDSYYAPSANGSLADFDGPVDGWTGGEDTAVVPSYWDPHILEQMSMFSIGSPGPSAPNMQPFQPDGMTEYAMMASFQYPQAPAAFSFDHSISLPQTTIFNYPGPISVPYTVANAMPSHNFTPF